MGNAIATVLGAAQRLSEEDQLALIEALSHSLRQHYRRPIPGGNSIEIGDTLPVGIARTPPVDNIALLLNDFWPDNETADDVNVFIAQQRAEDQRREG